MSDYDRLRQREYQQLADELCELLTSSHPAVGVLLTGSVARGDVRLGSDLDLLVFRDGGAGKSFNTEQRRGIRVEITSLDVNEAERELVEQPMRVYTYIDGRILFDPEGRIRNLTDQASTIYRTYRTPTKDREAIAYWLESVANRLEASIETGDDLRTGFLTSTVSWKMIEGLWAASNRPLPPSGTVLSRISDIADDPFPLAAHLRKAFGSDTYERARATLTIIHRTIERLRTT